MSKTRFHGFASHTWVVDEEKRNNHDRVLQISRVLEKSHQIRLWVVADQMKGQILDAMCDGIDESEVFVLFLTKAYIDKVHQRVDLCDNCKLEFQYGMQQRHSQGKTILVLMESCVKDKRLWNGSVNSHILLFQQ